MEGEELFPPKKRVKSSMWECFGYPKNYQGVIVEDGLPRCKTCHKKSNTSNMFQHLRDNLVKQFVSLCDGLYKKK